MIVGLLVAVMALTITMVEDKHMVTPIYISVVMPRRPTPRVFSAAARYSKGVKVVEDSSCSGWQAVKETANAVRRETAKAVRPTFGLIDAIRFISFQ